MNDKKICFITCVNDDRQYEECLLYINNLNIPEGCEIDTISVKQAGSMAQGYNAAMQSTDAKYKVYLHQDTFIINKNFIYDVLRTFNSDENIGMIGVVGAKTIPTNGIWWKSNYKYGQVYENHTGNMELLAFNEIKNNYEEVKAIDGLIMITQYDIRWREDIFDGWHFYDASQSVEFNLAGYKVVVPIQNKPWCIHDCGLVNMKNGYDVYKNKFLNEYSKKIFPLVSILIPTYNRPKYFELALESVLNQTYKNIEIIIGDDSTNDETEKLVNENYLNKYNNIKYYHNVKNLGQFDNDLKLYDMANGEFINYLMDDDLFEKTKIQKMMNYFVNDINEDISLVTSHRAIIDGDGNIGSIFGNTDDIFKKDTMIGGIDFGNFILKTNFNCIGEPTTVLFRKNKLSEPFGVYNNRRYGCNVDQASWFNLLSTGKAVFINEALSYFRIHDNQQLASNKMKLLGALDYAHEVLTAREKGFLIKDSDFKTALSSSLRYCQSVVDYFKNVKIEDKQKVKELKKNCEKLKQKLDQNSQINNKLNAKETNRLPLVSILIPAYNQTKYLKEALESAINQTYPNIEIIIGDDSTTDEVENFVKPYLEKYNNISYFKNVRNEIDYGLSNTNALLERSNGEYINYLYHDDVFHPQKIEKMMNYYLNRNDITLVTSHRQLIDENGNYISDDGATKRLFNKDKILDGIELGRFCLNNLTNYIGEATTVLFKKSLVLNQLFKFNNNSYSNIGDLAMWLSLLKKGRAVYISESLSCFRRHSLQNTYKPEIFLLGVVEWKKIIYDSYEKGFVYSYKEYKSLILKWFNLFSYLLKNSNLKNVNIELINRLKQSFKETIDICFDSYDISEYYNEVFCKFYNLFNDKFYKKALVYINKYLKIKATIYKVNTIKNYCIKNELKYTILEGETRRRVLIPYYYNKDNEQKVLEAISPEIYVAELKNVDIVAENSSVISNDYCLYDIAKNDDSNRYDLKFQSMLAIDDKFVIISCINSNIVIEKAIFLVGFASYNYYHFTVEILSRLQYIDSFKEYRSIPIIVDEIVKDIPQYNQLLNKVNKYNHKIIYAKKNYMYRVKELIYPSYNTWMPINIKHGIRLKAKDQLIAESAINYIRNNVIVNSNEYGFKKIFISRGNTANSRLANEKNVIELFEKYGFEIIYPEKLNFEEQVEIFSQAEYIAGASGAAFTNIIYCPKNANVLCIIPKQYNSYIYSSICNILKLRTIFVDAAVNSKGVTEASQCYSVNLDYCEKLLNHLLKK